MNTPKSISHELSRVWDHLTSRRRRQLSFLLLLMIVVSFFEVISIGAVIPFLGVLTSPERVFEYPLIQPLLQTFDIREPGQLLLPFTIVFGASALIAALMRLLLLWLNTRLSFAIGADFSLSIYRRTLQQPYAVHISRNSSEVINGILKKTDSMINTLSMILTLIGSTIMLSTILIALLYIEPLTAIASFTTFGLIYLLIIKLTRNRLLQNSHLIATETNQQMKLLQEGLGGIRDVLIDGTHSTYSRMYQQVDYPLRLAEGSSVFISGSPRFGMEALGMIAISLVAYKIALEPGGIAHAIPTLGALVLGAQRLLPDIQKLYGAWSVIQRERFSVHDALDLLDQHLPDEAQFKGLEPIVFQHHITLKQLSFRYSSETPMVLRNLNLKIPKGSRIGFVGTTGSGKSTLLDLVMGLLQPSEGCFLIDSQEITSVNNRSWQKYIAHVPQAIFLTDSTITENIAFGISKEHIDNDRVKAAAIQAQLSDTIELLPDKYQTIVGERGVRLSGGQRQRIGIARALYKKAEVIIFDEATSALDNETEQAVMQSIRNLSEHLTVLIVAHRLTTLKDCETIIEMSDGEIIRVGTYNEIIN